MFFPQFCPQPWFMSSLWITLSAHCVLLAWDGTGPRTLPCRVWGSPVFPSGMARFLEQRVLFTWGLCDVWGGSRASLG